ncbi:MAG: hypothetical protein AAFR23_02835 [Pseudomonadota bacterium]
MDAGLIGGLVGLGIAAVTYVFFSSIYVDVLEERGDRSAWVFRLLAYADFLFYPAVGFWIGTTFFSG